MLLVGGGGLEGLDVEGAVGLEFAAAHLVECLQTLAVNDVEQLLAGEGLALEGLLVDLAVADEEGGAAFEERG